MMYLPAISLVASSHGTQTDTTAQHSTENDATLLGATCKVAGEKKHLTVLLVALGQKQISTKQHITRHN